MFILNEQLLIVNKMAMKNEKYILDEAIDSLFKYTKIQAIIKDTMLKNDALNRICK